VDEQDVQGDQAQARRLPRRLRAVPGAGSTGPSERSTGTSPTDLVIDLTRPVLRTVGEADVPRHPGLDALLKDVDDLRTAMRRDLSLAATAASAGESDLAAFLLSSADDDVRGFGERADARLTDLADAPDDLPAAVGSDVLGPLAPARRARRLMPAAPLVAAAAALFVGLSGSIPTIGDGSFGSSTNASVNRSLDDLEDHIDAGATPDEVAGVVDEIHAELATLLAASGSDPEAAQAAIDLLNREAAVLSRSADGAHPQLQQAIAEARALVTLLKRNVRKPAAPKVTVPVPAPAPPQADPSPAPASPKATSSPKPASPKPSASSTPSAKPSATATPTPTASSSSSSGGSGGSDTGEGGPLPGLG
jgi:hypothetical protein